MLSRIRNAILSTAISCALASVAVAQTQTHKLLPEDGAPGDNFGRSVAISGNTAIVASSYDDDKGDQSGAAYLLEIHTGAQIAKLTPKDGAAYDYFGSSVAIDSRIAIVGSPFDRDNGVASGSAYFFDVGTGAQVAKLTPDDGARDDYFGYSVAISGNTAIVASYGDDDNGVYSGSAYLFDTYTGDQVVKLTPNDGAAYDYFGSSVAIDGGIAIVGSRYDDDNGVYSGSAYLFDAHTGAQIAKLTPNDGAAYDSFGSSVAISGNIAIVGSPRDDYKGAWSGSAYLFDVHTGAQIAKLTPEDGAAYDYFGQEVAISGDTAIVGSYGDNNNNGTRAGSSYLFDTYTGDQIAKLTPDDGAARDHFGSSVSISEKTAIVGSPDDDDKGASSGSAYLFSVPNSSPDPDATNIIRDGGFENDPNRSGPWSVVATGDVDVLISSELAQEASEDPLSDTNYLTIKSQKSDDEWTLGQLIREVDEFGEYQLSFSARSKMGSDLLVALRGEGYGDVEDPYFLPPTTFKLTSKWQEFTVNFNIDDRFKHLDQVLIAIGTTEDLEENECIDIGNVFLSTWLGAAVPMPQQPTELSARFVSHSAVMLEWDHPGGTGGVAGYLIFRDGEYIGSSVSRSYIDGRLTHEGPFEYQVAALDALGRESTLSKIERVGNFPMIWGYELLGESETVDGYGRIVSHPLRRLMAVSDDGRVFAGEGSSGNTVLYTNSRYGPEEIGNDRPEVFDISSRGKVVVGVDVFEEGVRAFRRIEGHSVQSLGLLYPDHRDSEAFSTSGDGSVIVGGSSGRSIYEAFRWTEKTGMVGLGHLPGGGSYSFAEAVSFDGTIIAGRSDSHRGVVGRPHTNFLWIEGEGMQFIEDKEMAWVTVLDISRDNRVLVGGSPDRTTGIYWTKKSGWKAETLDDFADKVGFDRGGFRFALIRKISVDKTRLLVSLVDEDYYRHPCRVHITFDKIEKDSNYLENGNFEESWRSWGLSRWDRSLSKEKKLVETPGFIGERAARIRMGNLAGDPKSLHLRQSGIELEPNTDYYLSFSAKASLPGTAKVRLFKDNNPSNNYGVDEEFELTTDWQTHVIEFRTDASGEPVSDGRLQFTFLRGGYKRVLEFFVDEVAIHEK